MIAADLNKPSLEELAHYGVKGMHWGVRKNSAPSASAVRVASLKGLGPDKIVRKTKNGDVMTLQKVKVTKLHKGLARLSQKYVDSYNNGANFEIRDKHGKHIGEATIDKRSNDELYLNWIGIDKSARGKGYATEVLKSAAYFGKKQGFKKMTLEVPGNSPDAQHIYTKLGFKITGGEEDPNDPVWGGLIEMEYKF